MKPTSEILERIEKCSSEHKDGVFTRLYRYLLREDIYYAAYQKLYANKGATTQGIDDDTADGFSDFYIKELIQSLKDGTYKANPVRREYIPKKNGKLRPLGIPSFRDKLLQEVVRMILEAMEQSAGKAVGQLEKLEQAAARKPSVLDNLKKAEKPEKAAPAPKRAEPEAAL